MKLDLAVFNSDKINKKLIKFSAAGLMRADENHQREALLAGAPVGTPAHIQHDMHRLIGWSRQLGHYIDGEMVRVLGCIEYPEDEAEYTELQDRTKRYWRHVNDAQIAPYRDELLARMKLSDEKDINYIFMESVFAERPGLATEIYPQYFAADSDLVDKDGLVDYRALISFAEEIFPGVFHDKNRDLVLVAHRFFRRRLSHQNALNSEFLRRFSGVASAHPHLKSRLRLDPDLIGHPASAKGRIELEYWRGPKFDNDISKISSGVAEYKADAQTRHYEGVDKTQIWWKSPEFRKIDDFFVSYRTFEVEELVEDESPGLAVGDYGCRYSHAEYSADVDMVTHFDGAIRAYEAEKYFQRIDASIDRCGKNSNYTKLFRFDGSLSISEWKTLLCEYYKGNRLLIEYFEGSGAAVPNVAKSLPNGNNAEAPLAAFISIVPGELPDRMVLYSELCQQIGNELLPFVEVGVGSVSKYLSDKIDEGVTPVGFQHDILNISRLGLGKSEKCAGEFCEFIKSLADALKSDTDMGLIKRASVPIMWEVDKMIVTLSLAGSARLVHEILAQLPMLIDVCKLPSAWIEALASAIMRIAPVEDASVIWEGVARGIIAIKRVGEVQVQWPENSPWTEAAFSNNPLNRSDKLNDTTTKEH